MPVVSQALDYSAARIPGRAIRNAGYEVVRRYLWFPGQGHPWLTAAEMRDLAESGLQVDAIYEQNTNDPAGGFAGGQRMANQAVSSAKAANLPPGSLIYFCADAWLSTHRIPLATAMDFLRGAAGPTRAAGYRLGGYGFADFLFEAARLGLADAYWLAGAEIPEQHRPGWLTSWQNNRGYVYVNNVQCDHNDNYRHSGAGGPGGGGGLRGVFMALSDAQQAELYEKVMNFHHWWQLGIAGAEHASLVGPVEGQTEHAVVSAVYESRRRLRAMEETLLELVGEVTTNPDLTVDQVRGLLQESARKQADLVVADVNAGVKTLVEEALGRVQDADNLDEAKKTVAELRKQLHEITAPPVTTQ